MPEIKRIHIDEKKKALVKEKIIDTLSNNEEIIFAYIFGSFIDNLPFRDIDIGIF